MPDIHIMSSTITDSQFCICFISFFRGVWVTAMTVIAGMIIGSGIFSTPSGILISVGSVGMSLIVWVIAALASVCGVLAYIELGSVSEGMDALGLLVTWLSSAQVGGQATWVASS